MSFMTAPVPMAVNLRRLFPTASFVGCGMLKVAAATDRSGECRPGCLFAAVRGSRSDGHHYISDAVSRGATALLAERPQASAAVPQCIVPDSRRAYAELCAALRGNPSHALGTVGVTGTNGKTTITYLVRSILAHAGLRTGLLGTIEYHDGRQQEKSSLTTPSAADLHRWLAGMLQNRATHAAMEISSHALHQDRTAGLQLDVAVLSNITQDHFDYHLNYEAYRASKQRIFRLLKPSGAAVLNCDDPGSLSTRPAAPSRVITYGLERPADVTATILEESLRGTVFQLQIRGVAVELRTRLIGRHNVSNCLAAAAVATHFEIPLIKIAEGIEALANVPGRMEPVECGQPFSILVDYAHTDDALRRCVRSLKQLTVGRVICVFGAGGDRDRTKRPLLGNAAGAADVAIITSDNPRSEDPAAIVQEILAGYPSDRTPAMVEVDRRLAIRRALELARPGDCVLIAGKGHETDQVCGSQRHHFDDREVVREEFSLTSRVHRPHFRAVHV